VILDAIRRGDVAAARAAGEAHILGGKRRLLEALTSSDAAR
jgi:DNA-binding GntR family transcriptional regulator